MKNKIVGFAALVLLASVPVFAKDAKVKNPGKNEVILIGRISVKAEEDMSFVTATRGLEEKDTQKASTYYIPFAPENEKKFDKDYEDFVDDNPKVLFTDGEFFYARYQVNKKTRNLKFQSVTKYRFFDSERTFIWLPFDFNVDVPQGTEAMYIGSFYFTTTGDDFVFSRMDHIDEYELAQEALDKVTKKHFDLYRADLKENPKEEQE